MEVKFNSRDDTDEFVMTLSTISTTVNVIVAFGDKVETGFSVYKVDVSEDDVEISSDTFVNFPSSIVTDYGPESINMDEIKGHFKDVSNRWYEYLKIIKETEDKKQAFVDIKMSSNLFYE